MDQVALSLCQAIVLVSIRPWPWVALLAFDTCVPILGTTRALLTQMSSNTGYRVVDGSFDNFENTIDERTESIQLKSNPFSEQTAAIPPNLQLFNSSQQTRKLFLSQSVRWIGTLIFVAFMVATLKVYQDKGNFSHDQKYAFNTIVTGLSLGLGLNFFVGQNLTSPRLFSGH